ncbi:hypothetical protein [Plantactinospora sp. CA-290183]|uniref:hypothetical protein n=1 Tax=Plantactinospora sp. CA-290183 TaxID=3240006 RepID=UPI003D8D0E5C
MATLREECTQILNLLPHAALNHASNCLRDTASQAKTVLRSSNHEYVRGAIAELDVALRATVDAVRQLDRATSTGRRFSERL